MKLHDKWVEELDLNENYQLTRLSIADSQAIERSRRLPWIIDGVYHHNTSLSTYTLCATFVIFVPTLLLRRDFPKFQHCRPLNSMADDKGRRLLAPKWRGSS